MLAQTKEALFYMGEWYALDNFSAFAVEIDGRLWPTAEHAYQAAKFESEQAVQAILACRSAHAAKKLAGKLNLEVRPGWDLVKLDVMEIILRAKLEQHEYVRKKLGQSRGLILIEDSAKDSFWGRGPDWRGQNNLGKLWMKIRDDVFGPI